MKSILVMASAAAVLALSSNAFAAPTDSAPAVPEVRYFKFLAPFINRMPESFLKNKFEAELCAAQGIWANGKKCRP